jgi:hypothetical protein
MRSSMAPVSHRVPVTMRAPPTRMRVAAARAVAARGPTAVAEGRAPPPGAPAARAAPMPGLVAAVWRQAEAQARAAPMQSRSALNADRVCPPKTVRMPAEPHPNPVTSGVVGPRSASCGAHRRVLRAAAAAAAVAAMRAVEAAAGRAATGAATAAAAGEPTAGARALTAPAAAILRITTATLALRIPPAERGAAPVRIARPKIRRAPVEAVCSDRTPRSWREWPESRARSNVRASRAGQRCTTKTSCPSGSISSNAPLDAAMVTPSWRRSANGALKPRDPRTPSSPSNTS